MLDDEFVKEQMRYIYNRNQRKNGLKRISKIDDILYNKMYAHKIIEYEKVLNKSLENEKVLINIKNNINYKKYDFLKSESHKDNEVVYLRSQIDYLKNDLGLLIKVEIYKETINIRAYRHNTYFNKLNMDSVLTYIEHIIGENPDSQLDLEPNKVEERNIPDFKQVDIKNVDSTPLPSESINSDLSKNMKISFPLDKEIYLPNEYIHPNWELKLNILKDESEYNYESAKRTLLNNGRKMNKMNVYHRSIIGSNLYHEMHFPVIGIKPNLEEFTDQNVWEDEKIYYKVKVREYIPFDSPDYYLSTSTNFGGVSIGNISKIKGKQNVGWGAIQKGEFYITERQLLLFDKGSGGLIKFINSALDADAYKRSVYWWTLNEIESIEGNKSEGTLIISTIDKKQHKLTKIDNSEKNIGFNEKELRYVVNLIGSLIEKTTR